MARWTTTEIRVRALELAQEAEGVGAQDHGAPVVNDVDKVLARAGRYAQFLLAAEGSRAKSRGSRAA